MVRIEFKAISKDATCPVCKRGTIKEMLQLVSGRRGSISVLILGVLLVGSGAAFAQAGEMTKSRIRVGGQTHYPPYEFLDENGRPAGFNVDLTRAIARQMGIEVDIRLESWGMVREGLRSGRFDILQGMFYSVQRDQEYSFSPPYSIIQHVIVTRKDSPALETIEQLKGKTILVVQGDIKQELAIAWGYGDRLVPVKTLEELLGRLARGEGDAGLAAWVPALYWIKKYDWSNLRISGPPVLTTEYCYAVREGDEKLLAIFTEGLAAVKQTGEYRVIRNRWLSPYETPEISRKMILEYVLIGAVPLLIALAGAFLWNYQLKRRVRQRTVELQRANAALQELNDTLEQRVTERTEQLRGVALQLGRAEQLERKRLAKILHDHLQQLIVAAMMQMRSMETGDDPSEMQAAARDIGGILQEAINASRSLAVDLSPPVLHEAGLIGGLKWLAGDIRKKHEFHVEVQAEKTAEPVFEEIRILLFESVRELLLNAVKHSGGSGAEVSLMRTEARHLQLTVSDDGRGFDPGVLKHRQADEVSFGLFSIQERLALVGGRMEIESAPGRGTRVTLTVSDGGSAETTRGMTRTAGEEEFDGVMTMRHKSELCRVLIVDDHKILRQGLVKLFRLEQDMEVVGEAADGPEAIELTGRLEPDVVIMDVNLGEMNGVEATRRILEHHPQVKVVGLSMYLDQGVADAMRGAGASAYVTKSGPSEELIAAVRRCCL